MTFKVKDGILVAGSTFVDGSRNTTTNNLTVAGNLTVSGTTTTLNTATLEVLDLNITVAKNAATASAANGAGLTVAGAAATLLYTSANDSWNFNKNLFASNLSGTNTGDNAGVTSVAGTTPIVSSGGNTPTISHAASGATAGTYNNVTINATGHVTAGSNVAYITGYTETDTLASVTGRGATTSTAVTFNGGITGSLTGNASTATSTPLVSVDNSIAYGRSGLQYVNVSGLAGDVANTTNTPTADWWHIIRGNHANGTGYYTDLALPMTAATNIRYRRISAGASSGWITVWDTTNLTNLNQLTNGPGYGTGTVTAVTATTPIISSGGTTPNITHATSGATAGTYNNVTINTFGHVTSGSNTAYLTGYTETDTLASVTGRGATTSTNVRLNGGVSTYMGDSGVLFQSYNSSASNAAQFNISHSLGAVTISNARGTLTLNGNVSGTAGSISGFNNPTTASTANTIVYRESNGYITNNYFHTTGGGSERLTTGMGYFAGFNSSDYYIRSFTAAAAASALSGQTMNINGNATTLTNFLVSTQTNNGIAVANNYIGYVSDYSGTALTAAVADGALYSQFYSASWQHEIYGDYRSGQIALRGKNNGTWQAWRTVLDSVNYNSYSPTLTGTGASGTWGINVTGNAATVTNGVYTTNSVLMDKGAISEAGLDAATVTGIYAVNYTGFSKNMLVWNTGGSTGTTQLEVMYGGTGAIRLRNRTDNTTWTSWRELLHSNNYTSYSPSLTGSGASGTWGISVTGNAATVGSLSVHSGTNNEVNKIVRTDGSGYIQAGWINTISGDNGTTAIDRIYASSDAYLRYYTPANFRTVLDVPTRGGTGASGSWGISVTGNAATATATTNLSGAGGNYIVSSSSGTSYSGAIQVRESGLAGVQGSAMAYAPRLAFHWSGVVASSIAIEPSGRIGIFSNAGTAYEAFVCAALTASTGTFSGAISASNFSGSSSGTNTGDQTNISGNAATASAVSMSAARTDTAAYPVVWGTTGATSQLYSCTAVNIQSSTGTLNVTTLYASANVTAYSDERVKTNWRELGNVFVKDLAKVKSGIYDRTDCELTQVGVSAQSLQNVLPNAVIEDEEGKLSVAYGHAALVSAIELAKEIVLLKNKLQTQDERIAKLEAFINRL